jgi:alginate O-acetyltransferase complex protein AlgI
MYKRKSEPVKRLLDFSLFVTFFPHLVAGPIVRPPQLVPQFESPRKATQQQLSNGLFLVTLGLFMKVVLADSMLSSTADTIFSTPAKLNTLDAWMGVLAFSGQIFFDFAGYSTCAIGVASSLGFVLPENFRYPYAALGFTDFWKRWHITLSAWLRDYLYIPLGGNRKGEFRTYFNLMITMLLGGLWHGASWTFVVWGALHGSYLCIEKLLTRRKAAKEPMDMEGAVPVVVTASLAPAFLRTKTINKIMLALLTFFLVNVTWVFFRSADFTTAWRLLTSMFTNTTGGLALLSGLSILKVTVITVAMLICHWLLRNKKVTQVAANKPWWLVGIVWAGMLVLLLLSQDSSSSFIYFQF